MTNMMNEDDDVDLRMEELVLKLFKSYINGDTGLALTYLMAKST